MEYTEENLLNISSRKTNDKRKNKTFIDMLYKNKLINMIIFSLLILSSIDLIMIYQFLKILQNI